MTYLEAPQNTNTDHLVILAHADANLKRRLPMFIESRAREGRALIVGGGRSLRPLLPTLQSKSSRGMVWAVNGSHDWLIERGITPTVHVLLDARPSTADFVRRPQKGVFYLVASQCHPSVFDALEDYNVLQWSAYAEGMAEVAGNHPDKPICLIGGGETVGLKAMLLAYLSGFRRIELFGMDSSYTDGRGHAYEQPQNEGEKVEEVTICGKTFKASPWMKRQAFQFVEQRAMLEKLGCRVKAHGKGLLPWLSEHAMTTEAHG